MRIYRLTTALTPTPRASLFERGPASKGWLEKEGRQAKSLGAGYAGR